MRVQDVISAHASAHTGSPAALPVRQRELEGAFAQLSAGSDLQRSRRPPASDATRGEVMAQAGRDEP